MSSAKVQSHPLHEQKGQHSLCMSEGGSKDNDVCCDCFKLHMCLVHIRKSRGESFMLVKTGLLQRMTVLLALLVTHASTLVTGKRLVSDEGVYKGLEIVRSLFCFITYFFLRFTKKPFEF